MVRVGRRRAEVVPGVGAKLRAEIMALPVSRGTATKNPSDLPHLTVWILWIAPFSKNSKVVCRALADPGTPAPCIYYTCTRARVI